ncbi:DUF4062 domain-containing protein [Shewanella sp. SM73]|uniref:DUF4062 domain-containing protein n=1 Tax=Shewanella TaxID=22 RepID=UPI0021D9BD49|nr:DUF4062 domain-containing protein [Shewanella sp. SM73]MCU8029619.1 DUF4062 domain-containing protein [Shewanella sp. SM73]
MAIPRVFISSTCYDLKHIRENLKYFVKTIGYEPVLSDDGDVYYSVDAHTHDACLTEVATCQLFILIIGGRYGGEHKGKEGSITNNEYREAVKNKTPVFALVESAVYSDHYTYNSNKKTNPEFYEKITYPSIDNIKIFGFIDEVRKNSLNNAIVSFNDFSDMEAYLKKQWAGMMYDLLAERTRNDNARITNRLIDDLTIAARKSEELIKVLLRTADAEHAEEKISEVDLIAKARSFPNLLANLFSTHYVSMSDVNQLPDPREHKYWYDFLIATNDFVITKNVVNGITTCFLHDKGKVYLELGSESELQNNTIGFNEIQSAFEALKRVDPEIRKSILEEFIVPF